MCHQNYLSSGAFEIQSSHAMYEKYELNNKQDWKRMNTFWCCNVCSGDKKPDNTLLHGPMLQMVEENGRKIYYPAENVMENGELLSIDSLIMVPKKPVGSISSKKCSVLNIYSNPDPTNTLISNMYKNRQAKFEQRMLHCDIYEGEINLHQNRELKTIAKIIDTSIIKGSSSNIRKKRNNIISQFTQYGQAAIGINIHVDVNNIETYITTKLCQGSVITLEINGDINEEFSTHYFIHNHTNAEVCDNQCIRTEITEIDEDLDSKFIPVFLSSLSQKHNSFVENFIKNSNFDLHAENYHFGVDFQLDGSARIYGLAWTINCDLFNEELSLSSLNGNPMALKAEQYLQYLENSILTTANSSDIRNTLGIHEQESNQINRLAQKYQVHLNRPEREVYLPSYETMFRLPPPENARSNLNSSKTFLQYFKSVGGG